MSFPGNPVGKRLPRRHVELAVALAGRNAAAVREGSTFSDAAAEAVYLVAKAGAAGCRAEDEAIGARAQIAAGDGRRQMLEEVCSVQTRMETVAVHAQPGRQEEVEVDEALRVPTTRNGSERIAIVGNFERIGARAAACIPAALQLDKGVVDRRFRFVVFGYAV